MGSLMPSTEDCKPVIHPALLSRGEHQAYVGVHALELCGQQTATLRLMLGRQRAVVFPITLTVRGFHYCPQKPRPVERSELSTVVLERVYFVKKVLEVYMLAELFS